MEVIFLTLMGAISIMSVIFGMAVYSADRKSESNRSFTFFTFIIAAWLLADYSVYQSSLTNYQVMLNRMDLAVISLMILGLSYFVNLFPREIIKIPKFILWLVVVFTIVMYFGIIFSDKFVQSAWMEPYGSNFSQGPLFSVFAAFSSVLTLYAIVILIIKYYRFKGIEKEQIRYVLWGIALLCVLNLIFNLFIPMVTKNFVYGRLGTYSSIFFVAFTAYAIMRHRLFNLKIILTQAAAVLINVISIVQIFTARSAMDSLLRSLFAVLIFYSSYLLIISVKKEIAQREKIEHLAKQLEKANEGLKELDIEKSNFISMASHELNSPLTAINGYLSMILEEKMGGVLSQTHHKYLNNVFVSTKRLMHLVSDLLNVTRIEEKRIHLVYSEVDLNEVIKQTLVELRPNIDEMRHKVTINLAKNLPLTWCDRDRISEVVINLTSNAVKYTDARGHIEISSEVIGHDIKITVKDNGIGISKEGQTRLFGKFEQGNISRDQRKGTGLGLFIVKNLVELHKGKIWLESEEGKGTAFHFSLPIVKQKPADQHEDEGAVLKLS